MALNMTRMSHIFFKASPHSEIALHAPTVLYVDMKCPLKTTEYPSTSYPISVDPF